MNPKLLKAGAAIKNAILGGGEGKVINAVGNILDQLHYSPDEKQKHLTDLKRLQMEDDNAKADHALKELELGIEAQRVENADRADARDMQKAALGQEDLFSKRFIYYLAAFMILAAVTFGILFFFVPVPAGNKRMVEMFADVFLFAGALTVLNFFFSSSIGSRKSGDVLRDAAKEKLK